MNRFTTGLAMVATLVASAAYGADVKVKLSGDQENPPVQTSAAGMGTISVADDGSVSGSVTTTGIDGTMGHIHVGAVGANGPVAVKLEKDGNTFKVPAGTKLTPDQLASFKAGALYINVHSEAHKAGEIRGQLK